MLIILDQPELLQPAAKFNLVILDIWVFNLKNTIRIKDNKETDLQQNEKTKVVWIVSSVTNNFFLVFF